jgi:hypothetical protein
MKLIRFESERASAVSWRGLGEKMVLTRRPHSSVLKKKENRKTEGERGALASWAGSGWLGWIGPRVGPVGLSSFFFVLNLFFFFCFLFLS